MSNMFVWKDGLRQKHISPKKYFWDLRFQSIIVQLSVKVFKVLNNFDANFCPGRLSLCGKHSRNDHKDISRISKVEFPFVKTASLIAEWNNVLSKCVWKNKMCEKWD
jgi:hypothetical protein